jgi:hypothetical protein
MTEDTNVTTNSGNGSTPLSREDNIRAQVHCLIKLAGRARQDAAQAYQAALEVSVALSQGLAGYLTLPTIEQQDAFEAFFKAESNGGATQADREREAKICALWSELHPGCIYAPNRSPAPTEEDDDGIPF